MKYAIITAKNMDNQLPVIDYEDRKGGRCSKCGIWKGGDYGINGNGEPSYHKCLPPTEGCEMCHGKVKDEDDCICRHPELKKEGWEERFDKEFEVDKDTTYYVHFPHDVEVRLKSFIRTELTKAREDGFNEGMKHAIKNLKID